MPRPRDAARELRAHAAAGRHRRHVHAAGFHRTARWPAARDQAEHHVCSAACASCAASCAMPAVQIRCSRADRRRSRASRSRPPHWLRSRRRARRRALFHHRPWRVARRGSDHCRSPRCAGRKRTNARLSAMGVRTLGELMRLPRAGFAKRFGVERLADLDRLLGRRADPRRRLSATRAISRTSRSRS